MKFPIKKRKNTNTSRYFTEDIDIARKFAKVMYREFGNFISSLILFGSAAHTTANPKRDIDILIVLDDVRVEFSEELVHTYRIIVEKAIAQTEPKRLHVQSMKLTSFWEYMRAGDPVAINILRTGVALIDTNLFDPLQALLDRGRIRPSAESVWTYFTMSPASLQRAEQHILTAVLDLYWAAIDAAHAVLMTQGHIPPSPNHVADMLEKELGSGYHLSKKSVSTMKELYHLFKGITHRDIKTVNGKEYDALKKKTQDFVNEMKGYIEYHHKKTGIP